MENLKVHIVEDEVIIAYDLQDIIESMGHRVIDISTSVDEAIAKLDSAQLDFFIVDIHLKGDKKGFELGQVLKELDIPFIYMSSVESMRASAKDEAYAFLSKPFDQRDVQKAVKTICRSICLAST